MHEAVRTLRSDSERLLDSALGRRMTEAVLAGGSLSRELCGAVTGSGHDAALMN